MKNVSPYLLTLLAALPLIAQEQPAYDSDDLVLEGRVSATKEKAEAGDAYSMRQLYLRYSLAGKSAQAAAWAQRFTDAVAAKADAGDTESMRNLGILYQKGEACIAPDPGKAISWLTKASDAGDTHAAYMLGDLLKQAGNDSAAHVSYARAYGLYKEQGDLFNQGYMEQNGIGTDADPAAGIAHMQQALEAGSTAAAYQLFKTYECGIGTAADESKALDYAQILADKANDARMAYLVADVYLKGKAGRNDKAAGEKYLEQAVQARLPEALYHKAWLKEQANDYQEALSLYREAATMGHPDAAVKAGKILLYGLGGVETDDTTGLNMLHVAAEKLDSPIAPYELGLYYDSIGEGALADDWYIKASDEGLAEAMARRGWLHLNPFSAVEWSPTETFRWWQRGAEVDADCKLYYNLYRFAFIPLLLTMVFGIPLWVLYRVCGKGGAQD